MPYCISRVEQRPSRKIFNYSQRGIMRWIYRVLKPNHFYLGIISLFWLIKPLIYLSLLWFGRFQDRDFAQSTTFLKSSWTQNEVSECHTHSVSSCHCRTLTAWARMTVLSKKILFPFSNVIFGTYIYSMKLWLYIES